MALESAYAGISFSIIIESENLGTSDEAALMSALHALEAQTLPIRTANEALLVNTGDISDSAKLTIAEKFPWISIREQQASLSYYEVKQTEASHITGDVVLFCDCDIKYDKNWLAEILKPFSDSSIQVVTGETAINANGPYTLFIQLSWCFPPHSRRRRPFQTRGYPANNVAFRRALLDRFPIPAFPRLYRGNCSLHARLLERAGIPTFKAPLAKAIHPVIPPAHAPIRFFMWGHHEARIARALHAGLEPGPTRLLRILASAITILARRAVVPLMRIPSSMKKPSLILSLPIALVLTVLAYATFASGMVISLLIPGLDLARCGTWLERHRA
jgi:hypothetical protein